MKLNRSAQRRRSFAALGMVVSAAMLLATSLSSAAEAPVGLGTAGSFAVLAGAGVTNTGPTVISGDLGTCPTLAITGFPPGTVTNGTVHAGDAVCLQAQSDLTVAYNDAAGRPPTVTYPGVKDLGGQTLPSGVYKADSFAITGTLTLDAQGDPAAVFIFQAGSTLITAPDSRVVLINGAQACNVFWQVGSSATLGVNSTFVGTVLALTAITANTNAQVQGRLLARNAAVSLDSNTVTVPVCAPTPTTSTSTTLAPTTSTSTSTTLLPTTTTITVPPITVPPTTITVPPITVPPTTITVPPITVPPITVPPITVPPITVPPITVPPITVPPITVPPITVPPITVAPTTVAPTTVAPTTVQPVATTVATTTTTTTLAVATSTSSTTSTTTTTDATTTMDATTTTLAAAITETAASTTTTLAGASVTAQVAALARTGGSVRAIQIWAGISLALGGLLVLAARRIPAGTGR